MAFTRTNSQSASLGNLKALVGEWTGSAGDATGTITLKGGRLWFCQIMNMDDTSQTPRPTPYSVSESIGTITITVYNTHTVTTGRFLIIYS